MSASTELLVLFVAFAGLTALPVLVPWAAIRITVDLMEAHPVRPIGRRPVVPGAPRGRRSVRPVREESGPEPTPAEGLLTRGPRHF